MAQQAGSFEVTLRARRLLVPATGRVSHVQVTIVGRTLQWTGAARVLGTEIWHEQQKTLLKVAEVRSLNRSNFYSGRGSFSSIASNAANLFND